MSEITIWGFDGSAYVRTVKMLLLEKGIGAFEQHQVDVLAGETAQPAHLARHPWGKIPVVDVDGLRLIETTAITRYLNDTRPGPSLIPADPKDRARMDMIIGVVDSYGYGAFVGGVAAYHLFPDYVGGKSEAARRQGIENGRKVLDFAMTIRGSSPFAAGEISLADLYLAPSLAYVAMTPDAGELLAEPRVAEWWARIEARPSFQQTALNG